MLVTLNRRHLGKEQQMQRLSQSSPYLLKDKSSKRNPSVMDPLRGNFINKGKIDLDVGETGA